MWPDDESGIADKANAAEAHPRDGQIEDDLDERFRRRGDQFGELRVEFARSSPAHLLGHFVVEQTGRDGARSPLPRALGQNAIEVRTYRHMDVPHPV